MIRIDASEVAALAAEMGGAGARMQRAGSVETARTASAVEETQRSLAPVETGLLQSSISADTSGLTAEIGPNVPYDVFVVYGTSRMAPQDFVTPAADRHEPDYVDGVVAAAADSVFG